MVSGPSRNEHHWSQLKFCTNNYFQSPKEQEEQSRCIQSVSSEAFTRRANIRQRPLACSGITTKDREKGLYLFQIWLLKVGFILDKIISLAIHKRIRQKRYVSLYFSLISST